MNEKAKALFTAFLWRFWNTLKVSVLPAIFLVFLQELEAVGDLSCLKDPQMWMKIGYAGLVALIASILAGLDKVSRESIRLGE